MTTGIDASTETRQHVLNERGEGKEDREWEGEGVRQAEGERVESRREYLTSLSQPLIKAVHDLETLSSAVQLSASPGVISQTGIALQQDLLKVHFLYSENVPMHTVHSVLSYTVFLTEFLSKHITYM